MFFYYWIFISYLFWYLIGIALVSSLFLMYLTSVIDNLDFWRHNGCSCDWKYLFFIVGYSYPILPGSKLVLHLFLACFWCSWLLWWKIWIFEATKDVNNFFLLKIFIFFVDLHILYALIPSWHCTCL